MQNICAFCEQQTTQQIY